MEKKLVKERAEALLEEIGCITDDILDDGADSRDFGQNRNFTSERKKLDRVHAEIAGLELSGPGFDADTEWRNSWEGTNHRDLPENIINHDIRYLNRLIEFCTKPD